MKKQLAFSCLIPRKQGRIEKADIFIFIFKSFGPDYKLDEEIPFLFFLLVKNKTKKPHSYNLPQARQRGLM